MIRLILAVWLWATHHDDTTLIKLTTDAPPPDPVEPWHVIAPAPRTLEADAAWAWFVMVRETSRCDQLDCIPCRIVAQTVGHSK